MSSSSSSSSSRRAGGAGAFVSGAMFMMSIVVPMFLSPISLLEHLSSKEYSVYYPSEGNTNNNGAIFITGCSSGIGRHAALSLANDGYTVFATVRNEEDGTSLLNEFNKNKNNKDDGSSSSIMDSNLHPIVCDVTQPSQVQAARETVEYWIQNIPSSSSETTNPQNEEGDEKGKKNHHHRVLIGIVNNAGITSELEMLENMSMEGLDHVLNVNLKGAFLVYQIFLPLLRSSSSGGGGRIVNVGSLSGQAARPFRGSYTISKFALEGFSDTQRQELLFENISVSMVNPGYIQTNLASKNFAMTKAKYGDSIASERTDLTPLQLDLLQAFEVSYRKAFESAGTPEDTTVAIRHALFSRYPKTRYYPGTIGMKSIPAWIFPKMKLLLPDRVLDKLVVKVTAK